jgi:hypothetical protein
VPWLIGGERSLHTVNCLNSAGLVKNEVCAWPMKEMPYVKSVELADVMRLAQFGAYVLPTHAYADG